MHRWLPAFLLIVLLAGFRILGSAFPETLPNLQPLPALLVCSMIFLKGRQRWLLPLGVWILTDPFASFLQGHALFGWHHLGILSGLAVTAAIALRFRENANASRTLAAAVLSAIAFYIASNTIAFAADALYPKTFGGFLQAQWSGPANLGPTWIFLRNLLVGNLLFTSVFLIARSVLPRPSAQPAEAFSR